MLLYLVSAKYGPEIEAAVRRAVQASRLDEQLRAHGGAGYIEADRIDESRTGLIAVAVGGNLEAVVNAVVPTGESKA